MKASTWPLHNPILTPSLSSFFKGETFECPAQGLVNSVNQMGAVPTVIPLDDMSTAGKTILSPGKGDVTKRFARMQCHFSFHGNFCNPVTGHEKGSGENYLGYSHKDLFFLVPKFDDLEEYNKQPPGEA